MKVKTCSNPNCRQDNPQPLNEFWRRAASPDGLFPRCKHCLKEYRSQPKVRDRENAYKRSDRAKALRREYRKRPDVKAKERAYNKEYQKRDKVKRRAKEREQTPRYKATRKAYRKTKARKKALKRYNNSEKRIQVSRKYLASEKGQRNIRKYVAIRMARSHGAEGSYTQDEWEALCAKYNHRCIACGKNRKLTVDHIEPLSEGGTNYIDNIQPLCKPCNSSKGNKTIDYRH